MKPPLASRPIRVIHFTRALARQCPLEGSGVFDWMVCDTIANGARRPTGRKGPAGKPVLRFERTLPAVFGVPGTFAVLAEVSRDRCLALELAPAPRGGKKTRPAGDFFVRSGSK